MHMLVKAATAAVCALAATGCTTTFQAANVDPTTGRFAATSRVPPEAIQVREAFDVDSTRRMVFVRSNLAAADRYDAYFETSLENLGFFGEVMRKDEFERMLVRDGHASTVPSVDGFAGLARAAEVYGPFLVVDFDVSADVGYQVDLKMTVYNAADATEKLRVDYGITNWAGLDSTLFQPVFNVLVDWLDENSPTYPSSATAAPAAAAPEAAAAATPSQASTQPAPQPEQ